MTSRTPSHLTSRAARARTGISGPLALIQAVPYLLGFHPHDSLVLVGLRDRRLQVTARLDLDAALVPEVLQGTLESLRRGDVAEVVAVVFGDALALDPSGALAEGELLAQVVDGLFDGADALELTVGDVLLVADGRWRSALCPDEACCPAEGEPVPPAPSAFAAAATVDGVAPAASREELGERFTPLPAQQRAQLDPLIARQEHRAVQARVDGHARRHRRAEVRALFAAARARDDGRAPGPEQIARYGAALSDTDVRDRVWLGIDAGRLDGRALWLHLARALPQPYDAAPLFLYAWAAWRAGDGTVAGLAADRALDADPGYSAAGMLESLLRAGMDPRTFPPLGQR